MLWVEPYSIPPCQTKRARRKEKKEFQVKWQQEALGDLCTYCFLTVQQLNKKVSCKATPGEPKHSPRLDHHKERGIYPVLEMV